MNAEKKFGELFNELGKLIRFHYQNMKYKPGGKDVDRFFEAEKPITVCQKTGKI